MGEKPMRVLFEAFWWAEGPPSLRRVLQQTVGHWSQEFPRDELAVLIPRDAVGDQSLSTLPTSTARFTTRFRPQGLAAAFGTRRAQREFRPDVVIAQNFAARANKGVKSVVFIQDVLFLQHPEWFTRAENLYFRGMTLLARRADILFASSESEASRIRRYLPRAKVTPVGLGIGPDLKALKGDASLGVSLGILPKKFVLSVGRLNARKNLMTVLQAAIASDRVTADFPLVVVGEADGLQEKLPREILDAVESRRIIYTGFVSDDELVWLYRNTSLFVFMSHDEGYGLPPIEAQYFGANVVVSDIPVFRELLAKGATFVPANDSLRLSRIMSEATDSVIVEKNEADYWQTNHNWSKTVRLMRENIVSEVSVK